VVGVQWHPERLPANAPGRSVFTQLVNAAKAWRASSESINVVRFTRDGIADAVAAARERGERPRSEGLLRVLGRAAERDRDAER
jgi:hypothetical protein